jgi:vacuolar-type H+-ATPase subunit I/STV1
MALNGIDLMMTILWTVIFTVLGIVSCIGLRTVVTLCTPGFAAAIAWRNIQYARILSLVFGALYLAYGATFGALRGWLPTDERGWVGAFGYLLVLMHMGALRMIIDEYDRERALAAQASNVVPRQ